MLTDVLPDVLAFTAFLVSHWQKLWWNNPLERLNKEICRRSDVVGIFPNQSATRRLVGAVMAEQHDELAERGRYFTFANALDADTTPANHILVGRSLNNINEDDPYCTICVEPPGRYGSYAVGYRSGCNRRL